MTITREQLEASALAYGIDESWIGNAAYMDGMLSTWRPHLDDGGAVRLAVRLQIDVAFGHHITHKVYASRSTAFPSCPISVAHDGTEPDKLRAWCEAVTLCAAAVGERMRKGGA